ncbi:MAG: 2Fe-2S iron-sulfur cluster-binding protein [Raineya sp.]
MKKYQLKVKDIIHETADAISIVLEQPTNETIKFKAGQFLTLNFNLGGETIRRAYSLASCPYTEKDLKVTVKRVKDGKISNLLNNSLQQGDYLDVLEPMGVFTPEISPENALQYILWAGGSGITPIMAMLKAILYQEPKSKVVLVYANRDEESIIFKNELKSLQEQFKERLEVIHVLSQPQNGWEGYKGRLDAQKVTEILSKYTSGLPLSQWMCGPEGMMQTIAEVCEQKGLAKPKKENFSASIEESAQRKLEENQGIVEREVIVKYDGETYKFKVSPKKTILEAALDLDIDLPYSCQSGLCTACMGKCVSGKVMMTEDDCLTDQEMRDGVVLTCVAHPLTDDVVIEID